jgi:hypothetical protein
VVVVGWIADGLLLHKKKKKKKKRNWRRKERSCFRAGS